MFFAILWTCLKRLTLGVFTLCTDTGMFWHFWEMCCFHLQGDWSGSNRCLCNRKEGKEVVGIAASEGHRKEKSRYDLHWSNGNCKLQEWPQKKKKPSVSVTDQLSYNHTASPQPLSIQLNRFRHPEVGGSTFLWNIETYL